MIVHVCMLLVFLYIMKTLFLIDNMHFIFIKITLTGRTKKVGVCDWDTVEYVKIKIQDTENVPIDEQRLIYGTRQLEDDYKTLFDYGVKRNATIHLVVRISGAPGQYNSIIVTVFI